jgi:hypothetical protein
MAGKGRSQGAFVGGQQAEFARFVLLLTPVLKDPDDSSQTLFLRCSLYRESGVHPILV